MAWDGNGNFIRTNGVFSGADTWEDQAASADAFINSGRHDTHDEDLATGMENTVTRDGQNSALENLPMAANRHTQVGDALTRDNYAAAGQVQDDAFNYIPPPNVGGTGDAITLTPSPAITNYEIGQYFAFKVELNNTTEITINVSGLGATAVQKDDGRVMFADDFLAGALVVVRYDGAAFLWQNQQVPIRIQGAMVQGDANGNATELKIGTPGQVVQASNDGLDVVYGPPLARGYQDGVTLSNNTGDPDEDVDISAGVVRSDADDANLEFDAAVGKQLAVSWAPGGTPAAPTGGMASSQAFAADILYYCFAGLVSGVPEIGFDTSSTGANLIADNGFSNLRDRGKVRTDSVPSVIPFVQDGGDFWLDVPVQDFSDTNPGTTRQTKLLPSVPLGPGIKVIAGVELVDTTTNSGTHMLITLPSQTDTVPSGSLKHISLRSAGGINTQGEIYGRFRTNDSAQIAYRLSSSAASKSVNWMTFGWEDARGQDG